MPVFIPFAGVCLWAALQTVPWMPEEWHHPLWNETRRALGPDAAGSISLSPFESWSGLMRLLTYAAIFFLSAQLCRNRANAWRLISLIAIMGTVYASYGLFVELTGAQSVLWTDKDQYRHNLTSVFIYKNAYAAYAGFGLLAAFTILIRALARAGVKGASDNTVRRDMMVGFLEHGQIPLAMIVIIFVALIMTDSRAGLASVICGLGIFFAGMAIRHGPAIPYLKTIIVSLVAVVVTLGIAGGERLDNRWIQNDLDLRQRTEVYKATIAAIKDRPLLGTGLDTYETVIPAYFDEALHKVSALRAHNSYLENSFELGIPATMLLVTTVVVIVIVIAHGVRQRRRDFLFGCMGLGCGVQVALHSLVDFPLQVPAVTVTMSAILGMAFAQSWRSGRGDKE